MSTSSVSLPVRLPARLRSRAGARSIVSRRPELLALLVLAVGFRVGIDLATPPGELYSVTATEVFE